MKIYNYNAETKEYLSTEEAQKSPLEKNVYLIPANATTIATIGVKEDEVAIFDGEKWVVEKDYRNQKVYSMETQQEQKVDYIGDIKDGYTLLQPFENCQWNGKKWELDLYKIKLQKIAEVSRVKTTHLTKGVDYKGITFYSDSSTMLILGAIVMSQSTPLVFKGRNGTIKAPTLADITAIYTLVQNNINLSFAAENEVIEIIKQAEDFQNLDVEKLFNEKLTEVAND